MNVPIKVKGGGLDLPDVTVTFYMSKMLTAEQEQYLERLIDGWYGVGAHEGFGGRLHFMHDIIFDDEQTICLSLDMGSAPIEALDILYKIVIDSLNIFEVKIEKIVLE
jgi:hypothetical protein